MTETFFNRFFREVIVILQTDLWRRAETRRAVSFLGEMDRRGNLDPIGRALLCGLRQELLSSSGDPFELPELESADPQQHSLKGLGPFDHPARFFLIADGGVDPHEGILDLAVHDQARRGLD